MDEGTLDGVEDGIVLGTREGEQDGVFVGIAVG
jgi:hypothetical protein